MALLINSPAVALRDAFGITQAIETGTWQGDGTIYLARHFDRVWSVEIDDHWYDHCFAITRMYPHVSLINGDSAIALRVLLNELYNPVLFWLDAHWCAGNGQLRLDIECPLLDELEAITDSQVEPYILIDDAKYFVDGDLNGMHTPEQWPSFDEIKAALPDGHFVAVHNDMIVSVPDKAREVVEAWRDTLP